MSRCLHCLAAAALSLAAVAVGLAAGVADAPPTALLPRVARLALLGGVPVASILYVTARETRRVLREGGGHGPGAGDVAAALSVTVAAPLTRWLAVEAGLGVVVAAAVVGLLAALCVPDHAAAAYCGSFVGMAAPSVLAGYVTVTAAGAVAGVAFVAGRRAFAGFGGKLGTTAFVGCSVAVLATGASPDPAASLPVPTAVRAVGVAALAAVATRWLSARLDHGPVVGSAAVGLVAGLVLPAVAPEGATLAAAAFCASFAGMASTERLPGSLPMLVAGLASGVLFVGTAPWFGGFGGKLGTVAFVACLSTYGPLAAGADAVPVDLPAASG